MTAESASLHLVSEEEYLAGEQSSPVKHEYLAGAVYAMAGARNVHNRIATNALVSLGGMLLGRRCQPFNSDTKVRVNFQGHVRFYYPDVQIVCDPNPPNDTFQDHPVVILEVISEETRRTDEQEKRDAYLSIPSLRVYLLIEQSRYLATVWRRTAGEWIREVVTGYDAVVPLPEIEAELSMREVFAGVELPPALAS
jgi:Uma2 family endonuclease